VLLGARAAIAKDASPRWLGWGVGLVGNGDIAGDVVVGDDVVGTMVGRKVGDVVNEEFIRDAIEVGNTVSDKAEIMKNFKDRTSIKRDGINTTMFKISTRFVSLDNFACGIFEFFRTNFHTKLHPKMLPVGEFLTWSILATGINPSIETS
jgi:hypothetical protein